MRSRCVYFKLYSRGRRYLSIVDRRVFMWVLTQFWWTVIYFLCAMHGNLQVISFSMYSAATEAVHFQNTKGVAKNMSAPLELIASGIFVANFCMEIQMNRIRNESHFLILHQMCLTIIARMRCLNDCSTHHPSCRSSHLFSWSHKVNNC